MFAAEFASFVLFPAQIDLPCDDGRFGSSPFVAPFEFGRVCADEFRYQRFDWLFGQQIEVEGELR